MSEFSFKNRILIKNILKNQVKSIVSKQRKTDGKQKFKKNKR